MIKNMKEGYAALKAKWGKYMTTTANTTDGMWAPGSLIGINTTDNTNTTTSPQQIVFTYPQTAYIPQPPLSYPRTQTDRDGTWVVLDPDEAAVPTGIILWKNGKAVKVTLQELLRQNGLEW